MELTQQHVNRIYFLGIGGIGMSALAFYFLQQGKTVSGYDRVASPISEKLEQKGATVFHILDTNHLEGIDLMIYTPAISADNIELKAARERGIPIFKRSQVLGMISKEFKTLAIAGTHGKTTTSAMLTHLLRSSGRDCTAFLGGIAHNLDGNFVLGTDELLVVEADEFDRSFMTLFPHLSLINSIDADHLDIYGDHTEMKATFRRFVDQLDDTGTLLVQEEVGEKVDWGRESLSFGIEKGDVQARNLVPKGLNTQFEIWEQGEKKGVATLPMAGHHNVSNMLGAMLAAVKCGIKWEPLIEAAGHFEGLYRRFDVRYHSERITYIDDYAHHPEEIRAALDSVRRHLPKREILLVFQPHLFTRTRDFQADFREALANVEHLLLMEIYPAREEPIPGIRSQILIREGLGIDHLICEKVDLIAAIESRLSPKMVVVSLGAGDIDRWVEKIAACVAAFDTA